MYWYGCKFGVIVDILILFSDKRSVGNRFFLIFNTKTLIIIIENCMKRIYTKRFLSLMLIAYVGSRFILISSLAHFLIPKNLPEVEISRVAICNDDSKEAFDITVWPWKGRKILLIPSVWNECSLPLCSANILPDYTLRIDSYPAFVSDITIQVSLHALYSQFTI
jgi:hypothetical protein